MGVPQTLEGDAGKPLDLDARPVEATGPSAGERETLRAGQRDVLRLCKT